MIVATHEFHNDQLAQVLEFLKRTRWELRMLRLVRLWPHRMQVLDINGDYFEISGVGYNDSCVTELLRSVNAAFDPNTIHLPTEQEYKELNAGRRHPWAEDRVM